jgi:hypothetical protein
MFCNYYFPSAMLPIIPQCPLKLFAILVVSRKQSYLCFCSPILCGTRRNCFGIIGSKERKVIGSRTLDMTTTSSLTIIFTSFSCSEPGVYEGYVTTSRNDHCLYKCRRPPVHGKASATRIDCLCCITCRSYSLCARTAS